MKAYEHLKISQLLRGGLYQRFSQFLNGHTQAITKGEFEQFEEEYMKQHKSMRSWITETKKKNTFKNN